MRNTVRMEKRDRRLVWFLLLGLFLFAAHAFEWRYDQFTDESAGVKRIVMVRTSRITGATEQYFSGLGWVRQGQAPPAEAMAPTQAAAVAPMPKPTPCPTPDPKNPYWHYTQFGACAQGR